MMEIRINTIIIKDSTILGVAGIILFWNVAWVWLIFKLFFVSLVFIILCRKEVMDEKTQKSIRSKAGWSFAKEHGTLVFLLITFGWSWSFWLLGIVFRGREDLLLTSIVLIGGFGPAVGGVLTKRLQSDKRNPFTGKRAVAFVLGFLVIFGLMMLRYNAGNIPDFNQLAVDLSVSAPIVLSAVVAALVGGWVISFAASANPDLKTRFRSLLPWKASFQWTLFGLLFYPVLILAAWGLASVTGLGVEYPVLWGEPFLQVLPLYALIFGLTAVAQGGNEEPGWRGMMQPELQKRFSPLVAALIVSAFWSLWHLPLYLNEFYPGPLVGGMIGGAVFRVFLSIFLAWVYLKSNGNLFAMILLHTSFNVMVNFLPTSDVGLTILWLIVSIAVIVESKMWLNPSKELNQNNQG